MATIGEFRKQRRNANKHTERGLKLLSESVERDGWIGALTVAADGETFDGSARLVTAQQDSQLEPIIVDSDGSRPVIVRRTDIATADDPKAKRLGVMANHVTATDWEPDAAVLAEIAKDDAVIAALAKEDARLAELLRGEAKQELKDAGELVDKAAELQAKWQVQRGDVWQVGRHRVMCGDSTNAADVARLMQGERAEIILTDPPYSSGGFQEAGKSSGSIGTRGTEKIQRDNLSTRGYRLLMQDVLSQFSDTDVLYLFTDWRMWIESFDIAERGGWRVRNMLVWDKEQMGMGFPWRNQHELILFGKRTSAELRDGKRGNVIRSKRSGNANHPTEKPVDVIEQLLGNTNGDIVFDPFNGSGTTIVACEQTGRIGRGMEIEPKYVAVTLERLSGLGLEATRNAG